MDIGNWEDICGVGVTCKFRLMGYFWYRSLLVSSHHLSGRQLMVREVVDENNPKRMVGAFLFLEDKLDSTRKLSLKFQITLLNQLVR